MRVSMNYRHTYHAGNHADVLKHAVLAKIIAYLAQKDKPFSVLDAHAGIGTYDLFGGEAQKTFEWQGGIGKLTEPLSAASEIFLAPYRAAISNLNRFGALQYYPGSPEIIMQGLRDQDRLFANELHPQDAQTLRQSYAGDSRLNILEVDALQAIKAKLPFAARRGFVLIDPPYEAVDETQRVADMLIQGLKRFASGIFMIWYPVTTDRFVDDFIHAIEILSVGNILRAELRVKVPHHDGGLSGSGLLIVNPPFVLAADLQKLLPDLADRLGIEGQGHGHVEWLTPPR